MPGLTQRPHITAEKILIKAANNLSLPSSQNTDLQLLEDLHLLTAEHQISIPLLKGFLCQYDQDRQKGILIHPATEEVLVNGAPLDRPLTRQEFMLLSLFLKQPGRIHHKDEIANEIWPNANGNVSDETIDKLVQRLRAKMEKDKGKPEFIKTIRRRGYQLKVN